MNIVDECRRHAQECRDLAANIESPAHRDELLKMAEIWERMGDERTQFITQSRHISLDNDD
jgi:hypothetical protein